MRHLILASLLLLPAVAMADDAQCKFHADRNLDLNLSGVRAVRFTVNSYDLRLDGNAAAGKGTVRGKACASDQETVDNLVVTQEKQGDTLVVELTNTRKGSWSGWGNHYANLKVDASVPSNLPVTVNVGSGDATVRGVASLDSMVGSGDLEVRDVKGAVSTKVNSGEFKSQDTGAITVQAISSGAFEATHVGGAVRIDAIGSGEATLGNVTGSVEIGSVGSGEAKVNDVTGNVGVGSVGSGSIDVDGVRGDFTVRTKGSGDVNHHGVTGKVSVPDKDR